jgi:polar amino acid transport system substrate-binding protein
MICHRGILTPVQPDFQSRVNTLPSGPDNRADEFAELTVMHEDVLAELASSGTLRAGLNMGNPLLITGSTAAGDPDGVSPDMAREIAGRLGVAIACVPFASPGELADAAADDVWDIALIGAEPARAEKIEFSAAYVVIEATYLVPADSPFSAIDDVDSEGVRIAVSGRSAYDLYLSRNLKHAELVRAKGLDASANLFADEKLDALAGLRPALNTEVEKRPGSRILDGYFTTVQQAIGVRRGNDAAAAFVRDFVEEAKASGFVARLLERHGVSGRLSVAPPAT